MPANQTSVQFVPTGGIQPHRRYYIAVKATNVRLVVLEHL